MTVLTPHSAHFNDNSGFLVNAPVEHREVLAKIVSEFFTFRVFRNRFNYHNQGPLVVARDLQHNLVNRIG